MREIVDERLVCANDAANEETKVAAKKQTVEEEMASTLRFAAGPLGGETCFVCDNEPGSRTIAMRGIYPDGTALVAARKLCSSPECTTRAAKLLWDYCNELGLKP